jgi:hypothetical protein
VNVESLKIEDLVPELPPLREGECWLFSSSYSASNSASHWLYSSSERISFRVSIVSDDGFYPQTIWERIRGEAKKERTKIWCWHYKTLKPEELSRECITLEVLKLVEQVYKIRVSQLLIEDFGGKVCQ